MVASSPNAVEQRMTFAFTVHLKPCTITPEDPAISAEYNQNVTLNVFLSDDLNHSAAISGNTVYFMWNYLPVYMIENGTAGWYWGWFIADESPSPLPIEIEIYHDVFGKYSSAASIPLKNVSKNKSYFFFFIILHNDTIPAAPKITTPA